MARFSAIAVLVSLLASSASAFTMAPLPRTVATPRTTGLRLMEPEDVDKLLTQANDCYEGECSLDEVDDLITILKEQQSQLYQRVEQIREMRKELEGAHDAGRGTDEIRETVRAIFRIFQMGDKASGNDYPALSKPTGWTGEVGDGPTDAYKSLNPKPWKPKS